MSIFRLFLTQYCARSTEGAQPAVVFTQSVQALFAAKQRGAMDTAAPAENA
ncbi:hypothetical protein NLO98_09015 [Pseudomonas syringae]|nr:hypothetical protein [Pseudomonas syringae]